MASTQIKNCVMACCAAMEVLHLMLPLFPTPMIWPIDLFWIFSLYFFLLTFDPSWPWPFLILTCSLLLLFNPVPIPFLLDPLSIPVFQDPWSFPFFCTSNLFPIFRFLSPFVSPTSEWVLATPLWTFDLWVNSWQLFLSPRFLIPLCFVFLDITCSPTTIYELTGYCTVTFSICFLLRSSIPL